MALTTARPPVTAIDELVSGTTNVEILNAGGDIDVNVAGVDVLDATQTEVTVAVDLDADLINGEHINLATTSGSTAILRSGATENALIGAGVFPFVFGANSLNNIIANTDGTVSLGAEGTAINHLVTKDYVDTAVAGQADLDNTSTLAAEGTASFSTDAGNLIFKWGKETGLAIEAETTVTFAAAFPSTCVGVWLSPLNTLMGTQEDNTVVRDTVTASQFTIWHPDGPGSNNNSLYWFALGF